jgi:UDP:flavonoid glycosyltransferase YjiC (YdhE family)
VQVVKAAPHSAVLRESVLAITHAGHGVTIKALAAGVPLVCLPMGRDQLDVAARVVHGGVGVRLEQTAAPADIAAAVEQVRGEASYREAAERIAATIAEETATDRAVQEIEAVLAAAPDRDPVIA